MTSNRSRPDADRERLFRHILRAIEIGSTTTLLMACGARTAIEADQLLYDGDGGSSGSAGAGGSSGLAGAGGSSGSAGTGSFCNVVPPSNATLARVCVTQTAPSCVPRNDAAQAVLAALGECLPPNPEFCSCDYRVVEVPCGPDPAVRGQCCYHAIVAQQRVCEGRPFVVRGEARKAGLARRNDWQRHGELWFERVIDGLETDGLTADTRRKLAHAWGTVGLAEHASIASFARFVLELLHVGAPAEFVRRAQEALRDEIRHAELCFGIASAYAGEPIGPGPLPIEDAFEPRNLAAIAASAALEGCINESVSALITAAARDAATDPGVHETLRRITEDENAHAALAWSFVAWACRQDQQAKNAVTRIFVNLHIDPTATTPGDLDTADLRAHGHLADAERARIARDALRDVVAPGAAALLKSTSSAESV
jgi:hypothetical protein